MKTSVTWMNDYLSPPATSEEQAAALTACGFPFEGEHAIEGDDMQQEIEMSSNRGDCVCHFGLAREIAALTGRALEAPSSEVTASGPPASDRIKVVNDEPKMCPRYTAQIITGVTVGPSPEWLQKRLRAIGQIPRNNLVDATNFILFELGQPTHVFDLDLIEGDTITIRRAHDDEAFSPLGEEAKPVKLKHSDLVITDRGRAIALAGVKGGADTAVGETTKDILIESATFDRLTVRNTSRRLGIASDSSYRFERGVHPAQVEIASHRLIHLILEIAGGTLHEGVIEDGAEIPAPAKIELRPQRCRDILGFDVSDDRMIESLELLGFAPRRQGELIEAVAPFHRLDVDSEIDLIEEIARIQGYENLPIDETMQLSVVPRQNDLHAIECIRRALVTAEFIETISHSLISERVADAFLEQGRETLRVNDDRAGGEPILRPSLLPSLLEIARRNRDRAGLNIRAFEIGAVFDCVGDKHRERRLLGMIIDGDADADPTERYRLLRGCIETLSHVLTGDSKTLEFSADQDEKRPWLQPAARITLDGKTIGHCGLLASDASGLFDPSGPLAVAEVEIEPMIAGFPPLPSPAPLPAFPSIDRDISVIVAEDTTWEMIDDAARSAGDALLESVSYVTTWRNEKLGADRKSVTLRLSFRDDSRTLTHGEVDPQIKQISAELIQRTGAEIRS
jgi:phenylalanyl-tRNA synthetase beta chain